MKINKIIYTLTITLLISVSSIIIAHAADINANLTGKTIATYYVRKGPGTTYAKAYGGNTTPLNANVTITKYSLTNDKSTGCASGIWYYVTKINNDTVNAYVCSTAIKLNSDHSKATSASEMKKMTDAQFEQYLKNEGFPSTYWAGLKALHKKHPNWVFKAALTFKDWNSIVTDESELGMSTVYINSSREQAGYEAYLETKYSKYYDWSKNMFYNYDGSSYLANKQAVAYFLDPRNFLTEDKIFMFEGLNYSENAKNSDIITGIIGTNTYTSKVLAACKEFNISPSFLASRIRQEGTVGTTATKGVGTKCNGLTYSATGKEFKGPLYNFYNIGATSSPTHAVYNGLCYAAQTDSNTFRPWNTPEKAIRGGAKFIGSGYINAGQYTQYFQKYNTSAAASKALGHQYMTNIEAPSGEGSIVFNKYKSLGQINNDFVFYIPYYLNMPSKTTLPKLGNPNNWLKSLKVDNTSVPSFNGNTTTYNVTVASNKTSVKIDALVVAKTSYVSVNGKAKALKQQSNTVNLTSTTTKINTVVTAGNGSTKTYTINITKKGTTPTPTSTANNTTSTVTQLISKANLKQKNNYLNGISLGTTATTIINNIQKIDKNAKVTVTNASNQTKTDKLVTGDKIQIISGKETVNMTIVIYGDASGDGKITIKDLLIVQKSILGYTKPVGAYKEAADANKDGQITIKDLLIIQKSILGYTNVSQI